MVRIAITKGRIEKDIYKLFKTSGFDTESIENKDRELLIKTRDNIEVVFTKSTDILSFVEKGIVDLGIIGKDVLNENSAANYSELLDLNIGKCYFALAGFPKYKTINKIATKYPNMVKNYLQKYDKKAEIVKMDGSVELAPIVGLADAIIDLVETGETLKANGLEVIEKLEDISTRLIGNNESIEKKHTEIYKIVEKLKGEQNVK
jgi:ATP phosphoribosyltransferase